MMAAKTNPGNTNNTARPLERPVRGFLRFETLMEHDYEAALVRGHVAVVATRIFNLPGPATTVLAARCRTAIAVRRQSHTHLPTAAL